MVCMTCDVPGGIQMQQTRCFEFHCGRGGWRYLTSVGRGVAAGRIALLTAALVSALACGSGTTGVQPSVYTAFVYGTIKTSQGAPVVGARIQSEAFVPTCASGTRVGAGSPTIAVTDDAGHFRHRVISERPVATQCVLVSVTAPGSTTITASGVADPVTFKLQSDASLPYDSARVDIVLP